VPNAENVLFSGWRQAKRQFFAVDLQNLAVQAEISDFLPS